MGMQLCILRQTLRFASTIRRGNAVAGVKYCLPQPFRPAQIPRSAICEPSCPSLKKSSVRQSLRFTLTFGALMAIGPFSINMYLPSLPTLEREFNAHPAQIQLTMAAYFIGMALGQMPYGALADRWGRRPPMLLGIILYTLASVGCALATSIEMMIACRFLQALGGCSIMVVVRAIVRDLFSPLEGAKVLSTLLLVMGVAPIMGPLIGGWVMLGFGWRAIFWTLAIYGALGLLTIWLAFPETRKPGSAQRPNLEPVQLQLRLLFTDRIFTGNVCSGALSQAAMFTYLAGSPYVLIEYLGVPVESYGLLFAMNAVGMIAGSQLNRGCLTRWGVQGVLTRVGILAAVSGSIMLWFAATQTGGLLGILLPMFACVFTQGFLIPNTSAAALVNHKQRAGFASGVLGTVQFTIGSITTVILGALSPQNAVPLAAIICATTVGSLAMRQFVVPRQPSARSRTRTGD